MEGKRFGLAVLLLGGAAAALAGEGPRVDDDLAVVKKAVRAPAPTSAPVRKTVARDARWLKVRILEHGGRSRINVKLPLAAVRAVGGDLPVEVKGERLRLSEILDTLDSGEPLVEINSEGSQIRVWIE
jgi:hypothetical protein